MMPHISGNADPPRDIKSWLKCQGNGKTLDTTLVLLPHDIYAIGTQVKGPKTFNQACENIA